MAAKASLVEKDGLRAETLLPVAQRRSPAFDQRSKPFVRQLHGNL